MFEHNSCSVGCHQNKNAGVQTSLITDDPSSVVLSETSQLSSKPANSLAKNGK